MTTPPNHQQLKINQLSRIFEDTTNSYKFYWFWSLLKQSRTNQVLSFKTLVVDMVALSWHTVGYYKLSLGSSDKLPEIIERIVALGELKEEARVEDIVLYLEACWEAQKTSPEQQALIKALKDLQNYVPYLFISPFFSQLPQRGKRRAIEEQSRVNYGVAEQTSIYRINAKKSRKGVKSITIHPTWQEYLQQHHKILKEFCWWNLSQFLRKRNPNVPSVGSKILPPYAHKRQLDNARKFWKIALSMPDLPPLYCLYTQQKLQANWPKDHFVPWSFVLEDQLWNLLPTPNTVNSSKSNSLPHPNYWEAFARIQYQAVQRFCATPTAPSKLLEDYIILYKTTVPKLAQISEEHFVKVLVDTLQPLMQQAKNSGFKEGWHWVE